MTDRIDHFAEARRLVSATETRDWNEESPERDRLTAEIETAPGRSFSFNRKETP